MKFEQSSGPPAGEEPSVAFGDEDARVRILDSYKIDALDDDDELLAITRFAARLCQAPVAFVSMVERDVQRFLTHEGLDLRTTPRKQSFCAHTMMRGEEMIVTDASSDPRFADNELVTGEPHVRFYAGAPLISPEGAPLGALCVIDDKPRPEGLDPLQIEGLQVLARAVMRRLDARRKGLAAVTREAEGARAMREIADLLPAIIWSADGDGTFDYFNSRWREVTGIDGPNCTDDWRPVVHPDDSDRVFADWGECYDAGQPFESEYRLKQADGSFRWTLSRALAIRNPDGSVRRWYGTLTDIDSSHRVSESRDLLARELSHRIKNIFAVVAGLVSIRARRHEAARPFADELIDAIRALGRAHDFVRPVEGAKGDSLRGLMTELMAPYSDGGERIVIGGKDCSIGPRAATPLALIFHELATNSAKYGALSVEGGKVAIEIDCPEGDGEAGITWRERGGPSTDAPGAEGFGSRLVQMSIEGQLGGRMERRFLPHGLEVDLAIPVSAIRS
ncbi:PAS domain-containing protein [Tsuneonella sp. YG55]|uniref:histidine kinase n=1 Tax=Tsuneonella litorea TaxID=2976475 RepID=A0A9X2W3I4_9SPHN|nr:PAS domain-containing protein [Tsuneonella litorea]MCT2559963.1 PAS domain-containing protein [Tsuneonella litorea]